MLLGHNMCREYRHQLSPATLHPIGPQYVPRVPASDVAGDFTCYWATISAGSTGIRCRRRHYMLLGPQYVPRVPASIVAGDNMCRGDNICCHTCRHRPNGLVFGFDKTHISLANAIKNVYHTIFNSHGFPYQFLLFVV